MDKDKLIQANGNIQELIIQIIELKKSEMSNYCVNPNGMFKCDSECISCKIKYFNKQEELMLKKYIVM